MIKKHLVFVLLGMIAVLSSCLKAQNEDSNTPAVQPQGNFSGQFIKEHKSSLTNTRDTVKLNVQLTLSGNSYQVNNVDDRHAASKGVYEFNKQVIIWYDNTISSSATNLNDPPYHLHGQFAYQYDGTNFNFSASDYSDTIKYTYILKRQP